MGQLEQAYLLKFHSLSDHFIKLPELLKNYFYMIQLFLLHGIILTALKILKVKILIEEMKFKVDMPLRNWKKDNKNVSI